jgi:NAD(P)-dependent dehydrogenase (short-subunit alcohol dehydrogenase family)
LPRQGQGSCWPLATSPTGGIVVRCDVTVAEDRTALIERAAEELGPVDVLVNNAGYAQSGAAEEETAEVISRTIDTNLVGAIHLCQLVAPLMRATGGGSIVNIASVSAFRSLDRYGLLSYAASKSGLVGATLELASQWGRDNIRVNAVAPGWFPTRMSGFLEDPEHVAWIASNNSLRRPGRLEEITGPVLFFAGDASTYVTGQVLRVDGGWR